MTYLYGIELQQAGMRHFKELLPFVSEDRAETIKKYKKEEDIYRSIYSEVLLRYALKERWNISLSAAPFSYGMHGKPYLKEYPQIYFNLSHSGSLCVCVLSEQEVGVDVEQVRELKTDLSKKVFSDDEHLTWSEMSEQEKTDYFYRIWTLKESYTKYTGEGLRQPFTEITFSFKENSIICNCNKALFFRQYETKKNYHLSVCSENPNMPEQLIFLDY